MGKKDKVDPVKKRVKGTMLFNTGSEDGGLKLINGEGEEDKNILYFDNSPINIDLTNQIDENESLPISSEGFIKEINNLKQDLIHKIYKRPNYTCVEDISNEIKNNGVKIDNLPTDRSIAYKLVIDLKNEVNKDIFASPSKNLIDFKDEYFNKRRTPISKRGTLTEELNITNSEKYLSGTAGEFSNIFFPLDGFKDQKITAWAKIQLEKGEENSYFRVFPLSNNTFSAFAEEEQSLGNFANNVSKIVRTGIGDYGNNTSTPANTNYLYDKNASTSFYYYVGITHQYEDNERFSWEEGTIKEGDYLIVGVQDEDDDSYTYPLKKINSEDNDNTEFRLTLSSNSLIYKNDVIKITDIFEETWINFEIWRQEKKGQRLRYVEGFAKAEYDRLVSRELKTAGALYSEKDFKKYQNYFILDESTNKIYENCYVNENSKELKLLGIPALTLNASKGGGKMYLYDLILSIEDIDIDNVENDYQSPISVTKTGNDNKKIEITINTEEHHPKQFYLYTKYNNYYFPYEEGKYAQDISFNDVKIDKVQIQFKTPSDFIKYIQNRINNIKQTLQWGEENE